MISYVMDGMNFFLKKMQIHIYKALLSYIFVSSSLRCAYNYIFVTMMHLQSSLICSMHALIINYKLIKTANLLV